MPGPQQYPYQVCTRFGVLAEVLAQLGGIVDNYNQCIVKGNE